MDFGKVSSGFGWRIHPITGKRSFHYGVDYPDKYRTPIYAIKTGFIFISKMQSNGKGFGNYVVIKHDNDYSMYAHLDERVVKQGDMVWQGELIGYMGTTGDSTGVHLHFGMCNSYNTSDINRSSWFDPLPILKTGVVSKGYVVDGEDVLANSVLVANQNYIRVQDIQDKLKIAEVAYDADNKLPIIKD